MVAKARWPLLLALAALSACAPDDFRGVEIRYMAWGNPQQLTLEKQFCEEFTKAHPNIRVKFIQTPSANYHDKMVLMLASRTAPDAMRVDHFDFPALVSKDYFHSLDDLIAKDPTYRSSDYIPTTVEEGRYKGGLYGVDVLFGAPVIYYNKDLLKKAGLAEPYDLWKRGEWTWDAYLRYAQAMTTRDKRGKPQTFGSYINAFPYQCAVVYAFGGRIMRDDQVTLAEDKSLEAFRFMHDLRFKYRVEPTTSQAANSIFNFDGGKLGMSIDWMGIAPRLRDAATFDWDVCPLPMKPGGTTMVKGNQLAMSAETRHPQETWEFMKYLTGRETERKLYVGLRRCFPTRKDVAYSEEYLRSGDKPPHHLDAFVSAIKTGRTMPITRRWPDWNREFSDAIEPLFNGTDPNVDAAMREAQKRANDALAVREGL